MSKRWMTVLVLLALFAFAVPAAYAAESESGSFMQVVREIFTRISAMIPPTGNPNPGPGSTP